MTWKDVPGFERYEVSSDGQVRFKLSNCIVEAKLSKKGYPIVSLRGSDEKLKSLSIHRLVLLTFVGPPPSLKHITRHLNGNPSDNHLSNLSWGTHWENISIDRKLHGRTALGSRQGLSRLTDELVVKILKERGLGFGCETLSKRYGVHRSTIKHIFAGRTWKHLPRP